MGLDTTHDCWHGAYSAFMRWRTKLAEVAGLPPLMLIESFYEPPPASSLEWIAPQKGPALRPSPEGGFIATRETLLEALSDKGACGDMRGVTLYLWLSQFLV